jgi:hypothetical protein
MPEPGDAEDFPLDANGPAYTASQQRHGVPLDYVGGKLASAIEDLHRFAINHPEYRRELIAPMYHSIVAYLALHNMLAKANDRSLVPRLLDASTDELHNWLAFVRREGNVSTSSAYKDATRRSLPSARYLRKPYISTYESLVTMRGYWSTSRSAPLASPTLSASGTAYAQQSLCWR